MVASGWIPPAALADRLDSAWVESVWSRLWQAVRDPVQRLEFDGAVQVQVLGVMRWRREPGAEGRVRVRVYAPVDGADVAGASGRCAWRVPLDHSIVLRPVLGDWAWLGAIEALCTVEALAQQAGRAGSEPDPKAVHAAVESLFRHFRQRLTASGELRTLRRTVMAALPLDAQLLRICDRLVSFGHAPQTPQALRLAEGARPTRRTLEDFRLVEAHATALRTLERKFPQLVAPYAALCESRGFPKAADPVEALHTHLLGLGFAPRTWRLLLDASPRLLLPLRSFYSGPAGDAVLDFLRILEDFGARRAPPPWFVWCALSTVANPEYRFNQHHDELMPGWPAWGVALRHLEQRADDPPPRDEVAAVAVWIYRSRPVLDKRQRQAGWPWMLRAARRWAERERAAQERQGQRWTSPVASPEGVQAVERLGYRLQPLEDGLALWDEGQAMRHCIADSLRDCVAGQVRVYSVRSLAEPTRRLATVRLRRWLRTWSLDGVRGFANQDPPPALRRAIDRWRLSLQAPAHRTGGCAPEPMPTLAKGRSNGEA